jgi:hypothetical protein
MKSLRIRCMAYDAKGEREPMTSIQVCFEDDETDHERAKRKVLVHVFRELDRYGLSEALNSIGILDQHGRRAKEEADRVLKDWQ